MNSLEKNSSLSNSEGCYCEYLVYNPHTAPLSINIMMFLNIMRAALVNCALCGGAVLAEIICQNTKCAFCTSGTQWNILAKRMHSDIDFFVHRFPSELNEYYGQPVNPLFTKREGLLVGFYTRFVSHILPWLNQVMGGGILGRLVISNYITNMVERPGYYNIHGIYEIIELGFEYGAQKLQIIVLDRLPEIREEWSSFVSSNFDIDIARTFVGNQYNGPPLVGFTSEEAAESFKSSSFVYTIRPAEDFERGFLRICKYRKRGFSIKRIHFDSRLLPFWKGYWMGRFSLLFVRTWTAEVLEKAITQRCNSSDDNMKQELNKLRSEIGANDVVAELIGQFLWIPPHKTDYLAMMLQQRKLEVRRQTHK